MELELADQPGQKTDDSRGGDAAEHEIRQLLELLPSDVVGELNLGTIDVRDPAFLEALGDHISRLALASPQQGKRLLGKLGRVKKLIRRSLRQSDPEARTSETITRSAPHVGRNDPCPCGSGRKFKQCCWRRATGKQG